MRNSRPYGPVVHMVGCSLSFLNSIAYSLPSNLAILSDVANVKVKKLSSEKQKQNKRLTASVLCELRMFEMVTISQRWFYRFDHSDTPLPNISPSHKRDLRNYSCNINIKVMYML